MPVEERYDPLDKRNLAFSLAVTFVERAPLQMPPANKRIPKTDGVGVYALYYKGSFSLYSRLSTQNQSQCVAPIYVGKAMPDGVRKGSLLAATADGEQSRMSDRLGIHHRKIKSSHEKNLEPQDFWYRWLPVQAVWIPFCESLLISAFQPLWNVVVDGFGGNVQGKNRKSAASAWNGLHLSAAPVDEALKSKIAKHLRQPSPVSPTKLREFIFKQFAQSTTNEGGGIPNPVDVKPIEET